MRIGTRASRYNPSGVGRRLTGVSGGVGEGVEDAVGVGVGDKSAGERFDGEEGDGRRIGVLAEGNGDRRKEVLSKCLMDISRPVIRWPWPGAN